MLYGFHDSVPNDNVSIENVVVRDAVVYGHKATCMLFLTAFQKWHFYIVILVNSTETQSKFK